MEYEITPKKITPHFMQALVAWQCKGRRAVDIKINTPWDGKDATCTIFCYDQSVMEGKFVTKIKDIPTSKELTKLKQVSIEREREILQKKIEELEGKA
jgi:hypothetical protein